MVDLHCHVLPGLDDGARSPEETVLMLEQAASSGITTIVATPHVDSNSQSDYIENIEKRHAEVREVAQKFNIELLVAAELFHSTLVPEQLEKWPGLFLDKSGRYVLLETSFNQKPLGLKEMVFDLSMKGIKVVFAHPERYLWLHDDEDMKDFLVHSGVIFQLDAGSLNGSFSNRVMKNAWKLLDEGIAHIVASDAHNPRGRSFEELLKSKEFILRERGEEVTELLFEKNPAKILNGDNNLLPIPPLKSQDKSILKKLSGFFG